MKLNLGVGFKRLFIVIQCAWGAALAGYFLGYTPWNLARQTSLDFQNQMYELEKTCKTDAERQAKIQLPSDNRPKRGETNIALIDRAFDQYHERQKLAAGFQRNCMAEWKALYSKSEATRPDTYWKALLSQFLTRNQNWDRWAALNAGSTLRFFLLLIFPTLAYSVLRIAAIIALWVYQGFRHEPTP